VGAGSTLAEGSREISVTQKRGFWGFGAPPHSVPTCAKIEGVAK
jgi:hypothetical protein